MRWTGRALSWATLAAVVAADALLWRAPLGVSAGVAGLLALGLAAARRPRALRHVEGVVLAAAGALAAASLPFEPGVLGFALALACAAALTSHGARAAPEPGAALLTVATFPFRATGRLVLDALFRRRKAARPAPSVLASLRGWLLPAAIALVFAALFALGDAAFASAASVALEWISVAALPTPARLAWWLMAAVLAWGLLRLRLPRSWSRLAALPSRDASDSWIGADLTIRTLALVHLVFAAENVLGIRHGWLGVPFEGSLAAGARHGAGALLLSVVLSAILVFVAFRPGAPAERSPAARGLAVAWLAQVLLVLVTAFLRLHEYVEAYSLTRSRLAALAGMTLVAAGLVLLAVRLVGRRDNAWLARSLSPAVLVVLLWACWTNVDGLIARFNVEHCREAGGEGVPLDVRYLVALGPEALPALYAARRLPTPSWSTSIDVHVARLQAQVLASHDPRGASLRRALLRRAIEAEARSAH